MKRDGFPSRVGSVLDRFFKNLGIEKKMKQLKALSQWREVVGETINAHTRPVAIRKRNLFVLVDTSSWLAQLTHLKEKIISEFDRKCAEAVVENIYFRLGEVRKSEPGRGAASGKEKKTRARLRTAELEKIEIILKPVKGTFLYQILRPILIKDRQFSKQRQEIPDDAQND